MTGTIDSKVERKRDEKHAKKEDPREGPGHTGAAAGSDLPDDQGESIAPGQSRRTPMAGQTPSKG